MENQTPSNETPIQPIENKDLHWRDERRRADDNVYAIKGLWLLFALVVILSVNILLISAIHMMTSFTYSQPEDVLSGYPGHTLLDTAGEDAMTAYLIRTAEGETLLVTAEKHFIFRRWQLVSAEAAGSNPPNARGDAYSLSATIAADTIISVSVISTGLDTNMVGLPDSIPFTTLIYAGLLFLMELVLWLVFRKIRK